MVHLTPPGSQSIHYYHGGEMSHDWTLRVNNSTRILSLRTSEVWLLQGIYGPFFTTRTKKKKHGRPSRSLIFRHPFRMMSVPGGSQVKKMLV